jgi:hypothetical protein
MSYSIYIHHQICMRYMYITQSQFETYRGKKEFMIICNYKNFHPLPQQITISIQYSILAFHLHLFSFRRVPRSMNSTWWQFFVFVQPGRIHRAEKRSQIATESTARSNAKPPCGNVHKSRLNPPSGEEKRSQIQAESTVRWNAHKFRRNSPRWEKKRSQILAESTMRRSALTAKTDQ